MLMYSESLSAKLEDEEGSNLVGEAADDEAAFSLFINSKYKLFSNFF